MVRTLVAALAVALGAAAGLDQARAADVTAALADSAVGVEQLGQTSAKGLPDTLNQATVESNSVTGLSVTGTITNVGSLNGNSGITTVFQNTGNNALFQATTIVNIRVQ